MAYQKLQSPKFKAITPSDSADIAYGDSDVPQAVAIFVGVGGDVELMDEKGNVEVFKNIPDGSFLPVLAKRVYATNTTATDIIALW